MLFQSGTQSNALSKTSTKGEEPTVAEFRDFVIAAIQAIAGFKDGEGEPINEEASGFLVMVPIGLWPIALKAINQAFIVESSSLVDNILKGAFGIRLIVNPRLDAHTYWYQDGYSRFVVFRTDGAMKPFIRLEEGGLEVNALAEGSEYAFWNNKFVYGANASRGVGYGYWQDACLVSIADA